MPIVLVILGIALAIWTISTAAKGRLGKPTMWSEHPVLVPGIFLLVSLALIMLGLTQ